MFFLLQGRHTQSSASHNSWEPAKLVKAHTAKNLPLTYPLQEKGRGLLWLMAPGLAKLLSRVGAWLIQHRAHSPLSESGLRNCQVGAAPTVPKTWGALLHPLRFASHEAQKQLGMCGWNLTVWISKAIIYPTSMWLHQREARPVAWNLR